MFRKSLLPACLLIGLFAGGPTFAAGDKASEKACLQNNRIWSWQAVNSTTLVVTDVSRKPFTVRLAGGCVGLTNIINTLRFRTTLDLGCLERGDQVSFREPSLGQMSCFVDEVKSGPPEKPEKAHPG